LEKIELDQENRFETSDEQRFDDQNRSTSIKTSIKMGKNSSMKNKLSIICFFSRRHMYPVIHQIKATTKQIA